jgi:hypothetical protein
VSTGEPVTEHEPNGAGQGIGGRARSEGLREGQSAVLAEHSTDEGGEPRPKGPTGGKAKPGIAFQWKETGERLGAHQPCQRNSIGLWSKGEASSTCGAADAMCRGTG